MQYVAAGTDITKFIVLLLLLTYYMRVLSKLSELP